MRLRLARIFLIFALCLSLGAHWAALQSVAWIGMLAEYSQQTSLADAVAKTFDGEHPCGLCKKIAGAQRAPKKNATVTLSLKPDLICSLHTVALRPRSSDISFAAFTADPAARVFSPIVPPPRSELA